MEITSYKQLRRELRKALIKVEAISVPSKVMENELKIDKVMYMNSADAAVKHINKLIEYVEKKITEQ